MPYRIVVEPRARKNLARIDPVIRRRVANAIDALDTDPEPTASAQLRSQKDVRRLRVGDYRVLYKIEREAWLVRLLDIDHRKDVYR